MRPGKGKRSADVKTAEYRKKPILILCLALTAVLFCSGCSGKPAQTGTALSLTLSAASVEAARPLVDVKLPEASGTLTYEKAGVTVDASHADQGYVMFRCSGAEKRIKVCISLGDEKYYYDLPADGAWVTFPLQMGSGTYAVRALEQVEGSSYAQIFSVPVSAELENELVPFTWPGQYVNYDADTDAVAWSFALCSALTDDGKKADALYDFVERHTSYDTEKAKTVQSGYIPDVDETLWSGKGICFDYASLLGAMLRAQGIPAQVIFGYVSPNDEYHAWNLVYTDGEWVLRDATLGQGRRNYTQTANY